MLTHDGYKAIGKTRLQKNMEWKITDYLGRFKTKLAKT